MRGNRIRLHGLDLSTKHVVSDTREPEMKKAATRQPRSKYGCLHWWCERTF
ncbi:hypothetical protein CJF03_001357 [Salmonella enterica subsp. enterica serovar Alachua]|nr:hypothetical protein [Salmonella enterica subsp. enterica serovar Alachua]